MSAHKLIDYLDEQQICYTTVTHAPAYTAQEIAHAAHIPGLELAKTVMVKLDGRLVEAVIPASRRLDLEKLRRASGAEKAELAEEPEFERCFPDCETGAMPPCGNLYGLEIYLSEEFSNDPMIAFNAGTHRELIYMKYSDYTRLFHPSILSAD